MPRKSVDNNFAELLCSLLPLGLTSSSVDDIVQFTIDNIDAGTLSCTDYTPWFDDLCCRKPKMVEKYMATWYEQSLPWSTVEKVILAGKYDADYPEIVQLNRGLDIKEKKSDVYILGTLKGTEDSVWFGLSVKASKKCPITNYSIEKILPESDDCRPLCKAILQGAGFAAFTKETRVPCNELFYNKDNAYWLHLENLIETHSDILMAEVAKGIISENTPYNVFEFDGHSFIDIKSINLEGAVLQPSDTFSKKKSGSPRRAAKLWYEIVKDEQILYKVEIRWKGNMFTASPQMITEKHYTCQ